ncbi:GerMN domain-containing protein [Treponema sp. OttesenSCG-928-L16]|nr:GerMN domain-containing protein [Treponema sp. OttesenSCG-928-L16]
MAERKRTKKKSAGQQKKKSYFPLLWLIFALIVACLFFVNREIIGNTLRNTKFLERVGAGSSAAVPEEADPLPQPPGLPETPPARETPPSSGSTGSAGISEQPAVPPVSAAPPAPPAEASPAPAAPSRPPEQPAPPVNLRDRAVYYMRLDGDGTIVRTRVVRALPASDSPMLDSLRSLLQGPSAEEQRKGLISLIPAGTTILSAMVRGETAYISFSEEFQFNTYGVEGYAAQLKQVVWTVTEFSNVKDVQVLIDGRRLDYLGESVWIGSPLGRDNL